MRRIWGCVVALALLGAACSGGSDQGAAPVTTAGNGVAGALGTGDGLVPMADWKARQDDYLAFATSKPMDPGSVGSLLAYGERAKREPSFHADLSTAKPADFQASFDKLKAFEDTGDFDINGYLNLWHNDRDQLDPGLRAAIEERILAFKYWWTEPTPPGIVDDQYYWTENHQMEFLANEYLAGQAFPDRTFTNANMTGRQHMDHAAPLIRRWLDLRSRFGWSEWLSNVYYEEDIEALMLVADWADDPDLATRASMALDLLLFEYAAHLQNGAFGATHGRSYMKDKMTALDEDGFSMAKLLWDDTTYPYQGVDTAIVLAISRRYRPPEALQKVARSNDVSVGRMRASQPIDTAGPVTASTASPNGFSYTSPDDLMVWWGMGAQFAWPIVPLSVGTINQYHLWETTNIKEAAGDLRPIVDNTPIPQLQQLAVQLDDQVNAGLLSEVNAYTWRSPEVMLSTAQDWRPGARSEQAHIWQATLDANAQVFTGLPRDKVPDGSDWHTNSGYWTGEGAAPRAAQFENVNVSIYAPQYAQSDSGPFRYQPFTHAYFPQDAFDEVSQRGNWTFGRKGDGYVALWSARPTRWVQYDGVTHPTRGMVKPFELIADGGPDNVWVTEVGRATDWQPKGGFAGFVDAVAAAPIDATKTGEGIGGGYDVRFTSPSKGEITFGWKTPLAVKGAPVELTGYPRYDFPWAKVDWAARRYRIDADGWFVDLDFDKGTRLTGHV